MEKVLDLIKETKSFNDYYEVVSANQSNNGSSLHELARKLNVSVKEALLRGASIEEVDDNIYIYIHNFLGCEKFSGNYFLGEYTGSSTYEVYVSKNDNDILLHGSVYAVLNEFNDTMVNERGQVSKAEEELLNEHFDEKLVGKANAYPSNSLKLK